MLNVSYHKNRLGKRLEDPTFRGEYEDARKQIGQVDSLMQALDAARLEAGISKAELARRVGKDPAAIRRLFSARVNPELRTVVAMASALGCEIALSRVPSSAPPTPSRRRKRAA